MPPSPKETVSSVVLDRQGIICAAEFKGIDFDNRHGWPQGSVVGQPFVSIHAMHAISIGEISKGVQRVCQGKEQQFRYRFDIREPSNDGLCEYELVAGHDSADADNIVVTYETLKSQASEISPEIALIEKNRKSLIAHTNIHAALFDHVPIGIIYQNNEGGIELVNPAAEKVLGASKDKIISIARGKVPWECVDRFGIRMPLGKIPSLRTLETGEPQRDVHIGIKRSSGDTSWITVNSELVLDSESGEQTGVLTTFVDITVERKAQEALKAQTERTQMAVESAEMGVWDWIPGAKNMVWDKKLFQLYGYQSENVISSLDAWKKAIHPEDVERVLREADDMMTSGRQKNIDYRVVWPNGRIRNLRSQARLVKDTEGDVTRVIGVTHDITSEVMAEKKLWELAYTDSLTGAYSRAGLNFRLSRTVARSLKRDSKFSVVMFGLSRFKDINDNYGLSVGDKILCEVSRRTQDMIGLDDTIARVGGDEFTLVLESVATEEEIHEFVHDFRTQVLKPIYLNEGLMVNLDAALGVSVFPDDGSDAAILQTNSGMAMQEDRLHELQSFKRYSPEMSAEVSRKFNLKYQLFSAVKDEEFQLYYQPIIDLHCNKVIGCEALIRWKDNHGNFVSPMEFIPVVEESGLICELGRWINLTAVKQWKMWQQLVPDLKYISVNVSPRQLETPTFVDDLMTMVHEYNIQPENLQLEITEGTFLQESENSDGALHKLASYGFRLAIDDFGTGYSSLAYLKRLNVDVIKIDRSFIIDIATDSSDRDIVSAILAMNKKLGFKTLVEGVETDEQNQIVHDLGCDSAQGYLYGKPTFADEFAETYISSQTQH